MRLANGERAQIAERKLTEYLLSGSHPEGRAKARFFGRHGFWRARPDSLREALQRIARTGRVRETFGSPYGTNYVVTGEILAPAGSVMRLRTVWLIPTGSVVPQLITAYPLEREAEP